MPGSKSEKVRLELCYESLCGPCAYFLLHSLNDLVHDPELLSIVHLHLYPWGNAMLAGNDTFACQEDHFPLIYCIESLQLEPEETKKSWESFFEKSGLDPKPVSNWYNGGVGQKLELEYGKATLSLDPHVEFVPWPSKGFLSAYTEEKVPLGIYYESLCPGSADFISNYVIDLFQDKELLSIVDVHLSPWGNTRIIDNNTIFCQHGLPECLLDTVEACVIDLWPKLEDHFPFIHCVEALAYEDYDKAVAEWESCFEKLGLDEKSVLDCTRNGRGRELELNYAAETYALRPKKVFVPWVVVDGKAIYEDQEHYINYICKAYKGSKVPKACSNLSNYDTQRTKAKPTVCYEETRMQQYESA